NLIALQVSDVGHITVVGEVVRLVVALLAMVVQIGAVVVDRVRLEHVNVADFQALAGDYPGMCLAGGQLEGLVVTIGSLPYANGSALQAPNGLSQGRVLLNRGTMGGVNQLRAARV